MLCLSRKNGESIDLFVGDVKIRVVVLRVDGHKIRMGIEAPSSVVVHRREVAIAAGLMQPEGGDD